MAPVILQALRGLHETLSSQIDPYIPEGILNKALEVSQIIEEHWVGPQSLVKGRGREEVYPLILSIHPSK